MAANIHSHFDIIIVGAGICGLYSARELVKKGKQVALLEARDRVGGRIHTTQPEGFSDKIETGAEFIHGNLPITIDLLKKYKIPFHQMEGDFWQVEYEGFKKENDRVQDHHHELEEQLKKLKQDMTLNNFLNNYFHDPRYATVAESARSFVQGYDAADPNRVSTFAFRDEWLNDAGQQYRIEGGYGALISELEKECRKRGCLIELSSPVENINWKPNAVKIQTQSGKYKSGKVLLTTPPSQFYDNNNKSSITFNPPINEKMDAFKNLGFGSVIKVVLEFKTPFWREEKVKNMVGRSLEKLGFLFSHASIPTWWTQFPNQVNTLTGWLGGPGVNKYIKEKNDRMLLMALESLSIIFHLPLNNLKEKLKAYYVSQWHKDEFSKGAYSYSVVDGDTFKKTIASPEQDTIYFAGEALGFNAPAGTVEAALSSARKIVQVI